MHKKCFMGGFYGILDWFLPFSSKKPHPVRHKNGQNFEFPTAGFQVERNGFAKDIPLVPELLDKLLGLFQVGGFDQDTLRPNSGDGFHRTRRQGFSFGQIEIECPPPIVFGLGKELGEKSRVKEPPVEPHVFLRG